MRAHMHTRTPEAPRNPTQGCARWELDRAQGISRWLEGQTTLDRALPLPESVPQPPCALPLQPRSLKYDFSLSSHGTICNLRLKRPSPSRWESAIRFIYNLSRTLFGGIKGRGKNFIWHEMVSIALSKMHFKFSVVND